MPIKKDGTGKRWVEMELLLPGTPEQVWQAIATGPGYSAWFATTEIEQRVGGLVRFAFGPDVISTGEVTKWEPPREFSYVERDWDKDAPPLATEITVTARSGDSCVVRMVHSLFTSSDAWDDQVEGFEKGWPSFFAVLRVYLAHFAGSHAASFVATRPSREDALPTWERSLELLGLSAANSGQRRTSASGPERWTGVVEHVYQDSRQRYLVLRTDEPSPGIVVVGTDAKGASPPSVGVCRYYYGDGAERLAKGGEPRWRDWLDEHFG